MENLFSDQNISRIHRSTIVSMNSISGYHSLAVQLGSTEFPLAGSISTLYWNGCKA